MQIKLHLCFHTLDLILFKIYLHVIHFFFIFSGIVRKIPMKIWCWYLNQNIWKWSLTFRIWKYWLPFYQKVLIFKLKDIYSCSKEYFLCKFQLPRFPLATWYYFWWVVLMLSSPALDIMSYTNVVKMMEKASGRSCISSEISMIAMIFLFILLNNQILI